VGRYTNTKTERSEAEMKYTYVAHGKWTSEAIQDTTKNIEKLKADAEKHGLKILAWGAVFGVSENLAVVYESEKGVDNYFNFVTSVELPYTDSRTTIIYRQ
jgi:uncharacterized protein with GYD domain